MNKNLIKVKWKTEKCSDNDCWCRLVVPVHPITDEDGNVWESILDAGTIGEELAEYIVGLHNCRLDQITTLEEYLKPELEKYIDFPKLLGVVDPSYVGMAKRNLTKPKPKITPAPTELKDVNKLSQQETNAMRYMKEYEKEHKGWLRMLNERMGIPSKCFGK